MYLPLTQSFRSFQAEFNYLELTHIPRAHRPFPSVKERAWIIELASSQRAEVSSDSWENTVWKDCAHGAMYLQ